MGDMKLDFQAGLIMGLFIVSGLLLFAFVSGIRQIARSRKLVYYQLRQKRISEGWKRILFSILLGGTVALSVPFLIERYEIQVNVFQPAAPTSALTLVSTPTSASAVAANITETLTSTPDPLALIRLPRSVAETFTGEITPAPDTAFSSMTISEDLNTEDYTPINPGLEFEYPIEKLISTFSYDKMPQNVQWSVLWFRDDEMIFFETIPWQDSAGGYGYAEITSENADLLPGFYLIEMYVGYKVVSSAEFIITGIAPTPTFTKAPTFTPTPTHTKAPTFTPTPTHTRFPTSTPLEN